MNAIETQVLRLIGEDPAAPDVFTDDDIGLEPIRDSVNEAIAEINMLTGGYTQTLTVPLVANRSFYRLSLETGDIAWVRTAWLAGVRRKLAQTSLLALQDDDPRWLQSRGSPNSYVPVGLSTFAFYPVPSATSDVIELSLVVIPRRYTQSADWLKVRRGWEFALVNYGASEYWASRGDARAATQHHELYAKAIGERFGYPSAQDYPPRLETQKVDSGTRLDPVINA